MAELPRVAVTLTQCWHKVPGGTASSVLHLVDAMASDGVDLVGVGPRSSAAPRPWAPAIDVRALPLPLPVLYDAWTHSGRPSVTSAVGSIDLLHLTVPISPPRSGAPLVVTVHDVLPLTMPAQFTGRGARLMRSGLTRIRERADMVTVPSRAVADDCEANGFDPDRLVIVPWGVHLPSISDDDVADVRERYDLGVPYVLFVGTQEPRKGLADLVSAIGLLDRADVTLAIAGPAGWGDDLGDLLAGVPSPVARLGFVPERDLPALYRGSAVFCFPSIAEGFGLPVLEAMAAGAAVITTRDTAMAEVAGDAAILVPAADPRSLSEAIGGLLDDPSTSADLGVRARERASGYTWDKAAEKMLAVYGQVMA